MLFTDLKIIEPILHALGEEGYTKPTPIQEKAIPFILAGKDLLGCAQTGTGKTAAFAIPMLQLLSKPKAMKPGHRPIRALILTPTRELAIQIEESFKAYGRGLRLKHAVIFGGVSQVPQTNLLDRGVDILVATPGRLLDLMSQGYIDLHEIEIFVLDEADRMLDMGFVHDVKKVITKLPVKRQTLFFSATMPKEIQALANAILQDPEKVEVTPVSSTADTIQQSLYFVDKANKRSLLAHLLQDNAIESALVFTRTKHGADKVVKDLVRIGIRAEAIHGNKSQNARQRALGNFKDRLTRILVATDIAARGIDIDELTHVINYELPNVPETYVHRIGRTGRAGLNGIAFSFCEAEELPYLKDIQKLIGKDLPRNNAHPYHIEFSVSASRPNAPVSHQKKQAPSRKPGSFNRNNSWKGDRQTGNRFSGQEKQLTKHFSKLYLCTANITNMFNKRTRIKELLASDNVNYEATVMGWVRSFRNNQFIALNDGSTNNNIQVVAALGMLDDATLKRINTGACIKASGEIIASLGKGQKVELKASAIEILGDSDAEKFPLQPKKHSLEFLREIAHLRFRTNTFGAVFRVRHALAFAIHDFFNKKGFVYIHTPIVTASDAEGAGEMFKVTTLPLDGSAPRNEDGSINFKEDFFARSTNLTVSGQLEGELAAMAFADIYTFGPTFRAENSNTTRHLAEFWMIEPEMAFYDLEDNMNLAEEFIKYIIRYALEHNREDLEFLAQRLEEEEKSKPQNERSEMGLLEKLDFVVNNDFQRLTYTEAIEILKESNHNKKKKFQYLIEGWGVDLQSEHERYLVEKHFKKPVILTNYPKAIKAFYMRQNEDGKTVAAMDILAPGIGEIVGGSQREERLDKLTERMQEMHIPTEELDWYLDTRRFGACPHAGFGLGFERMVQFVTGMGNIRDVIPFPRYPKSAAF